MPDRILDIFSWRGPTQIVRSIICVATVAMRYLMPGRRAQAVECHADQGANALRSFPLLSHKRNSQISVRIGAWAQRPARSILDVLHAVFWIDPVGGNRSPHRPETADLVVRPAFNYAPFFSNGTVSHFARFLRASGQRRRPCCKQGHASLLYLLSLLVAITASPSAAQTMLLTGAGTATSSSYQGPGDVVSGATAWYGLRAYNAAYATAGSNAINVRRASDNTTQNIAVLSTGALNVSGYNTFVGTDTTGTCTLSGTTAACTGQSGTVHVNDPVTGTGLTNPCIVATASQTAPTLEIAGTTSSCGTIAVGETFTFQVAGFVTEAYDQTGNGYNSSQSTAADQPQLLPNCVNSFPCVFYGGSPITLITSASISSYTYPYTYSVVSKRAAGAESRMLYFSSNASIEFSGLYGTNTADIYGGVTLSASQTDGSWHAFQGIVDGGSPNSILQVDGTATTGNAGTTTQSGTLTMGSAAGGGTFLVGYMTDVGLWHLAFTGTNISAMHSNQSAYYGTP